MTVTRGEAGPGQIESVTGSDVKMSVTSDHTMGQDQSSLRGVSGVSLMLCRQNISASILVFGTFLLWMRGFASVSMPPPLSILLPII